MSFTRKHYETAARIIRTQREHNAHYAGDGNSQFNQGAQWAAKVIGDRLSTMFASDNPRFDAERFAKACEPEVGK